MIECPCVKQLFFESLKDLLSQKPLEKIMVKEIAANVNLSTRTFYNYFSDKYDLASWYYIKYVRSCMVRVGDNYCWQEALLDSMKEIYQHKKYYSSLVQYDGQNSLLDTMYALSCSEFVNYIKKIENSNHLPDEMIFKVDFFYNGCIEMIRAWIVNGFKISPERFVDTINECVLPSLEPYRYGKCLESARK